MSTEPGRKHIPTLDGVRGLAIALVLVNHLTGFGGPQAFNSWINYLCWYGWVGVDLFFVLSGFLITGILLDSRTSDRYFRNFYLRRALRIFPLYYAILIACVVVLPRILPPEKAARFGAIDADLPYYFLYLQNYSIAAAGGPRHAVLDITWSLAIEEQFYLVWPVVVLLLGHKALKRVCLGLILFALLCRVWLISAHDPTAFAVYALTPCRVDALAVGAYIAVRQRQPGGLGIFAQWAPPIGVLCGVMSLTLIVLELHYGAAFPWAPGHGVFSLKFGFPIIALGFGALLVSILEAKDGSLLARCFSSRPAAFLGKYSYGIYLVHLPIRAVIRDRLYGPTYASPPHRFHTWAGSELPGQLVFYVLVVPPILIVAWLSYQLFEKHFLKLKRYLE